MRLRSLAALVGVLGGVGCAAGAGSTGRGHAGAVGLPAQPAPPPRIAYELPNAAVVVSHEKVCRAPLAGAHPLGDDQGPGWEFDPVPLHPLPFGAKIAEMPRWGPRRTPNDLFAAVRREAAHMNACYRWAQYRNKTGRAELTAHLAIDQWGVPSEVTVSGGGADLDGCVKEGLGVMRVSYRTPRLTKASIKLAFEPSGLGPPLRAPARPKPHAPEAPRSLCIQQPKPLPVDVLEPPSTLATFDDWSQEQDDFEWQRKNPGRRRPQVRFACTSVSAVIRPEDVERTIQSNLGVYRQCYSAALTRTPGLRGKLAVRAVLGDSGLVESASVQGPGDPTFAACMAAAFQELVLQPSAIGRYHLAYTFDLTPDPLPEIREANWLVLARARLQRLDTDGALEAFAEVVRASGGGPDECWGRLGVLQATLVKAPWAMDPRVSAAMEHFVRWAANVRRPGVHDACLAAAAPVIAGIAVWPFVPEAPTGVRHARVGRWVSSAFGHGAQDEALARAQLLLGKSPTVPGRLALMDFAASVLAARDDVDATVAALVPLLAERLDRDQIEPLLRALMHQSSRADAEPRPVLRSWGCPPEDAL